MRLAYVSHSMLVEACVLAQAHDIRGHSLHFFCPHVIAHSASLQDALTGMQAGSVASEIWE